MSMNWHSLPPSHIAHSLRWISPKLSCELVISLQLLSRQRCPLCFRLGRTFLWGDCGGSRSIALRPRGERVSNTHSFTLSLSLTFLLSPSSSSLSYLVPTGSIWRERCRWFASIRQVSYSRTKHCVADSYIIHNVWLAVELKWLVQNDRVQLTLARLEIWLPVKLCDRLRMISITLPPDFFYMNYTSYYSKKIARLTHSSSNWAPQEL